MDISTLAANILRSNHKLFFILYSLGNSNHREWQLVCVAFEDSIALHPTCLQDGKFLAEFYIAHSSDTRFNQVNQRYWLHYHSAHLSSTSIWSLLLVWCNICEG
jgi:hypothetical protein